MSEGMRIEEVPGTTPTPDELKSGVVVDFLKAVEKLSGKGWFKQNGDTLKQQLEASIAALPTLPADADQSELPPDTEKEAYRVQLIETIQANETLNAEYQTVYKALIDLAAVCTGGLEKLKEQAPLTVDKLRDIIGNALDFGKSSVDASGFNSLEWVRNRKKALVLVGQGPLASGRYEGEHDLLVQLENAILRAAS